MEIDSAREVSVLIRETRKLLKLSQTEFATKLGVSFHSVNRWENGRTHPLPLALKQVEGLLHQLGQPGEALLDQYFTPGEPKS
ncbi:MAG: helix-turn-helix domain-containing protein [Plectolyngbya sp. WJT66-NPBG17]|jgi:DNA-binding transcriptional regulator YiaG|nr:helix-turn-helix domain-containing protein [Plectolyngbya sp. WJT66-NPBG17]